jgi:hypothetical protein
LPALASPRSLRSSPLSSPPARASRERRA